ncbi:MAG: serine/threonine protein kinase [Myxococcales bacterium]|nr:serine/threonine protein kinase [Myxococcales bacterium]
MGAVFEARHTWTGRRVALKTLLTGLANDPQAVERFRREARAGVQGAHPHIAEVLDMGVDPIDGAIYLALEFLDGEDLARRLARDKTLAPDEALSLLVPAMMALEAAHRAGVVHRDIKPGNLFIAKMLDGETRLKVIDFGIANLADSAPVTRSGAPIGTPQYMAPEQARGEPDLDARVDVWSMGVVCFEVLSGQRPFDGARYHEVLAKVIAAKPPSLLSVAPSLDPALCAVIDAALEPERSKRIASMAEFARRLARLQSAQGQRWADLPQGESVPPGPTPYDAPELGPSTLQLPPEAPPLTPAPAARVSSAAVPETLVLVDTPIRPPLDAGPATDAPLVAPPKRRGDVGWRGWFTASLALLLVVSLVALGRRRDAMRSPALVQPAPSQGGLPMPPLHIPSPAPSPLPRAVAPSPHAVAPLAAAPRVSPEPPRPTTPRIPPRGVASRRVTPVNAPAPTAPAASPSPAINGAPVLEP